MPNKNGTLQAREFIFFCEDLALATVGEAFPRPERKVMWTILQLHYGNPAAHFEVQPSPGRGQVELGFHLEGPIEFNDRWAAELADHAVELMSELGPGWELEEWTATWRRLHRVFPFDRLDTDLGRLVGGELAKAMRVLHPYALRCAEGYQAPAPVVRAPHERREWRHKKVAR